MTRPLGLRIAFLLASALASGPAAAQETAPPPAIAEQAALERARRLDQAGRSDEAMRALEELLDAQPEAVSALVLLSQIAEREGVSERAVSRAEEAVRRDRSGLPAVRQVWIHALQSAGLADSALRVTHRWIEVEPQEAAAYGELSALQQRQGDFEAALRTLLEGRDRIGSQRIFVQEIAALRSARGEYEAAASEWTTMLAWGPPGVDAVLRSVEALSVGPRSEAVEALRKELASPEATFLERKAGVTLALAMREFEWARDLVRQLAREVPEPADAEVLREYVGRAADAGDVAGAAWAAGELARRSREPGDEQYWMGVSASYAVQAGAPDEARRALESLRRSSRPGSDVHELSLRKLHELSVDAAPEEADPLFAEYLALYPDRSAVVAMAVRSAEAWLDRGELGRARAALEAVSPSDVGEAALWAGSMGRLELLEGRPEAARISLEQAASVPTVDSSLRLDALERMALLDAADSTTVRSAMRAISAARRSTTSAALIDSVRAWATAGTAGGEILASFAARELEASRLSEAAAMVRREIVTGWPGTSAAPQAMLELARSSRREDPGGAREWLERLIVDYPESALAPVARRLLAEIDSEGIGA